MLTEDLDEVLRIQAECYQEVEPETRTSIRSKLQFSPNSCWVALNADRIVAYLICHPWEQDSLPPLNTEIESSPDRSLTFYIHDLAVGLNGRGCSVGRRLVLHALKFASDRNFRQTNLVAVQKSRSFWERFGFLARELKSPEAKKELRSYGEEAVFMELDLGNSV